MNAHPGVLVAFEGGDGAGKSTQARLLADALRAAGHEVVLTREPGGTPAAEAMRHVVLTPEHEGLDSRAEALLYAASRAEHVARLVRPALERGAVVVTDRYLDSSVAYQGVARGLGRDVVAELNLWATGGLLPDLTVVLDVEAGAGLARVADPNRLEGEPESFHAVAVQAFRDLAAADPGRYLVVPASGGREEIAAAVLARVEKLLADRGTAP
ncbi:MAG: dTMP kinase [Frankiales bacterium]|nr:dTMP kinase [Frankiales bacterium]